MRFSWVGGATGCTMYTSRCRQFARQLGIEAELALGVPPALVLVGGISMRVAMLRFCVAAIRLDAGEAGSWP